MKLFISFGCQQERLLANIQFGDLVLVWSELSIYRCDSNQVLGFEQSLITYIQNNSELIRDKTLQLLNQVTRIQINQSSIVDYLSVDLNFSSFWSSPIGEKCNIEKSLWIDKLTLLSAIYIIAHQNSIQEVVTLNPSFFNRTLIKGLFNRDQITISHFFEKRFAVQDSFSTLLSTVGAVGVMCAQLVIRPFAAILWILRHYKSISRLKHRLVPVANNKNDPQDKEILIFIDYYCYLQRLFSRTYCPVYWGGLFDCLDQEGLEFEVYHHYVSGLSPSTEECTQLAGIFMRSHSSCSRQLFFEELLSPLILTKSIKAWSKHLLKLVPTVLSLLSSGYPAAQLACMDHIKWHAGTGSLKAILYYHLYSRVFDTLYLSNARLKVIYLQENLDLEYSLLASLQHRTNLSIIGYPHSIVRFWDLRYFHLDSECFASNALSRPRHLPDKMLTNSQLNRHQLAAFYKNKRQLVDVEATRYESIAKPPSKAKENPNLRSHQNSCSVLLISGPEQHSASALVQAAITAVSILKQSYPQRVFRVGLKLHPQCKYKPNTTSYSGTTFKIETDPIFLIASQYDVAIVDSNTSAVIDTLSSRLPSVNYLAGRLVDLSPSSSFSVVETAVDVSSLVSCIKSIYSKKQTYSSLNTFYYSDEYLRWRNLLA